MATIKEVARWVGVFVGTVSNVITGAVVVSDGLKASVQRAVRELQFTPNQIARSLKTRQTKMTGMIISDITNPFFPEVVRGAEGAAMLCEHQYMPMTFNTGERLELENRALAELQAREVDGLLLVVVAQSRKDGAPIATVHGGGTPVACLDRITPGPPLDGLSFTNAQGSRECVRHPIRSVHKRIETITGSLSNQLRRIRRSFSMRFQEAAGVRARAVLAREAGNAAANGPAWSKLHDDDGRSARAGDRRTVIKSVHLRLETIRCGSASRLPGTPT